MVQLMMICLLQAAEYHNFGYFTSALAVNLLDRFMAAQPTSVSLKALHPAMLSSACHSISRALDRCMEGGVLSTYAVHQYSLNLFDRVVRVLCDVERGLLVQDEELWTLQLATVACLSIAAKMEEGIMPPDIAELQVWDPPLGLPVTAQLQVSSVKLMSQISVSLEQWTMTRAPKAFTPLEI